MVDGINYSYSKQICKFILNFSSNSNIAIYVKNWFLPLNFYKTCRAHVVCIVIDSWKNKTDIILPCCETLCGVQRFGSFQYLFWNETFTRYWFDFLFRNVTFSCFLFHLCFETEILILPVPLFVSKQIFNKLFVPQRSQSKVYLGAL